MDVHSRDGCSWQLEVSSIRSVTNVGFQQTPRAPVARLDEVAACCCAKPTQCWDDDITYMRVHGTGNWPRASGKWLAVPF